MPCFNSLHGCHNFLLGCGKFSVRVRRFPCSRPGKSATNLSKLLFIIDKSDRPRRRTEQNSLPQGIPFHYGARCRAAGRASVSLGTGRYRLAGTIQLSSVGVEISMAELYEGFTLADDPQNRASS
jgi:hypothetical protein